MRPDGKIHHVDSIHVEIPYTWILRRLGYEKDEHPDRHTLSLIEENVAVALSNSECSGAYRILKIESIKTGGVELEGGRPMKSSSISKFLSDCQYAALIFATAGGKITGEIESDIHGAKMTEALILDAAGSEIVEAATDQMQSIVSATVKKHGLRTKDARFSPGFGDFLLSNQKMIFDALDMSSHGIELTKTFQLVPEKSVTAICGLK